MEQPWHGQGCLLFDVVHPAISLRTTASPTLKDGFGEAVVAHDMPEPCQFPSLDNYQKRSLWTHKEVDLAPLPVVGLVLQVGDAEMLRKTLKHWKYLCNINTTSLQRKKEGKKGKKLALLIDRLYRIL